MALRHRQSRAARRGAAGGHRGGDIPTATPSRHLPALGTQPCGGRTRSRPCSAQRTPPGHPCHQHATVGDVWRSVPSALQSSPKAWSLSPQSHPGSPRPPWGWGVLGGQHEAEGLVSPQLRQCK